MAQWSTHRSDFYRGIYDECRRRALAILRDAADEWAKGSPEQPPTDKVLDELLSAFADSGFLRRQRQ